MSQYLWVKILGGLLWLGIIVFGATSWRIMMPRKIEPDNGVKTKMRLNKLPQLSLLICTIAVIVAIGSCATTWFIYTTGTRPQSEFQRIDVELQRLKERMEEEERVTEHLRTQDFDISWREDAIKRTKEVYLQAWDACYIEHDYVAAEKYLQKAAYLRLCSDSV